MTFTKGSTAVTIYANTVAEGYVNKLFVITIPTATGNQAVGTADNKVVDLLRNTRTFVVKGFITGTDSKTARAVRDELRYIFNGAGQNGGTTAMVYDTDTINGFMEKLNIVHDATDEPADFESGLTSYQEVAKYEVAITFVEGTEV